jgi:hypothetical protein
MVWNGTEQVLTKAKQKHSPLYRNIVSCSGGKLYNSKEKAISLFGEFQVKEEVHDV